MRVVHGNRGFCNINNEAVMIAWIRDHYAHPDGRPLRIAIVDTDVHHADGSQDIFWNDPDTLFISFHQDGRTSIPARASSVRTAAQRLLAGRSISPRPGHLGRGYLYVLRNIVFLSLTIQA